MIDWRNSSSCPGAGNGTHSSQYYEGYQCNKCSDVLPRVRENEIAEALAIRSPGDLRFEPVAPCDECGVDTETYYHLPTCSMSEDIVGVGV